MKNSLFDSNGVYTEGYNTNVALLEKEEVKENSNVKSAEELEEAKLRMKRNLEKLLNYDVYEEEAKLTDSQKVEEEISVSSELSVSEEDIRPTTTTMQFGTDDVDKMRTEMVADTNDAVGYKLNMKGKIAITIYSVVVAIIMALIVINTGVLATLSRANLSKTEELNTLKAEYQVKTEEIASISDDAYVLEQANAINEQLKIK